MEFLFKILIKCKLGTYQNIKTWAILNSLKRFSALSPGPLPYLDKCFEITSDLDVELSRLGRQGSLVQVVKVGVEQGLLC